MGRQEQNTEHERISTQHSEWKAFTELVRSDFSRYYHMIDLSGSGAVGENLASMRFARAMLTTYGLQASTCYRLGHALYSWAPTGVPDRLLRFIGRIVHWMLNRVVEAVTGISITSRARIGPGLYIGHFGGITLGEVTMGANCNISQGITLGKSGRAGDVGAPTFGDRVWIGPGAVVVGRISVGDDVLIGANTVVTRSLPARVSALGSPMRVVESTGSFDYVTYPMAEADPDRVRSRAQLANC